MTLQGGTSHPPRPHLGASHFGLCLRTVGCSDGIELNVLLPQVLPISFVTWRRRMICQEVVLYSHLRDLAALFWLHIGWILLQWAAFWNPEHAWWLKGLSLDNYTGLLLLLFHFQVALLGPQFFPLAEPYWRLQEVAIPSKMLTFFLPSPVKF